MFERINDIINANTNDLKKLAKAAGADYKLFWRGADLAGVDITGQDVSDLGLTRESIEYAITDSSTILPRMEEINSSTSTPATAVEHPPLPRGGLSSRIAPHIPYLRRYARALSGSQANGDAYVAAVLEALIADPTLFDFSETPRIALYRLFSSLWQSVEVNLRKQAPVFAPEERAVRNLLLIPPRPRQAFLLVAVEGFKTAEAASILAVDQEELSELIAEATLEIGRQMTTEVLIIEDEPLIAMDLQQLVESLGHSVNGIARTRSEAVEMFHRQRPGLILADIRLADGSSGIDAVNEIMITEKDVPIIFITAHPELLLTGDRPEPVFLVTKPFAPDVVKALITQAIYFDNSSISNDVRELAPLP